MEIIIKSRENGWETERRMELPEDDGLVKSILRSVKRRSSPPANAEEGVIEDQDPKETVLQKLSAVEDKGPAEDVRTVFETGAKGFLLIRCVSCGKEYSFNAKEPLKKSVCRACGTVTQLDELAIAELRCPACGRTWKYRTNSEEPEITCRCIQCGVRMTSRWNGKLKRYLPKE